MSMPQPEQVTRDLAFAIHIAREAGTRVESLRRTGRWKDEDMLADIGDQAADGWLRGIIEGRYPDDGVLSEETADSPARLSKSRTWIVDPLDGTREYSQMRDDWAVHVALTVEHRCALAAVALPAKQLVLWGVAIEGQQRAGIEGAKAGIELARGDAPGPLAPRMIVSRSHTPAWTPRFAELIGATELIPCGSVGYKTAQMLLGAADVYVHKKGLKEWDTCAPETVARALGWTVCKLRGAEHLYNQPDPKNHEFVVCRPAWRERVLAALAKSGALDG